MKIKPTDNLSFDDALRTLTAGIRNLRGTDGRARARGTGRKRVLRALRRVRAVLDEQYPAIIQRSAAPRLKTFEGREARLIRQGYVRATNDLVAAYAAAGVPVKRITHKVFDGSQTTFYIPTWARALGPNNPTKLRQAKKSVQLRKAVLAEKALRENSVMP